MKGLVSKETVVLHRCGSEMRKPVDKGQISSVSIVHLSEEIQKLHVVCHVIQGSGGVSLVEKLYR